MIEDRFKRADASQDMEDYPMGRKLARRLDRMERTLTTHTHKAQVR